MFRRIIDICKKNYGYKIAYAATPPEVSEDLIPWDDPAFESVGVDAYFHDFLGWDENWFLNLFARLKTYRKPIIVPDFGMMSFAGADKWELWNPLYRDSSPYDEEPQTRFTRRSLDLYNLARMMDAIGFNTAKCGVKKATASAIL